ncbi:MAG TPA: HAD-IC family P-type ATPase [Candidatus Acidoferrum sp.]|nr:HAD-IC family P-type ATPase [Candidatus Acidoferrum sp.]
MRRALPLARLRGAGSSPRGLDSEDVRARRARYGVNAILDIPEHAWRVIAQETARDPMLWFLAGVSALYAVVGQRTESLILLAAIAPLAVMDVVLHRRTSASTAGLQGRLAARADVIRDGVAAEVPAIDLVPGDLVVVTAGAPFPADGIVVAGHELYADESALTGEAYPVVKRTLDGADLVDVEADEVFVDGASWAFAGTRLLTNRASVRVAFTGGETLYGEIVRSATRGSRARRPLQMSIDRLVSVLIVAAAVVCVIVGAVRLRQGFGWLDALVSAATLATAALPEEFPLVLTVFLGVGVYRLARRQALVRRAVSVENIGRVTCICSDKTGTITEGRLRLLEAIAHPATSAAALLGLAALASRPSAGDPLDVVIAEAASAAGLRSDEHRVVTTFPFTESRKRETAIVREHDGRLIAVTKGAVEVVLAQTVLSPSEREAWHARVARLAEGGSKVLACAWRPVDASGDAGAAAEPDTGYRLAGVLAFGDPVREGVVEAVAACRAAGIHTIMATGDHPLTAASVARAVGLGGATPAVITGDELEAPDGPRGRALLGVDVIARATPAQKLGLVKALQEAGEIVAVTGDGVNDVPALQAADVGIAMGERATRSAREIASIVLLDDNFRTIVRAIGEGRQLFENLTLSFTYLLIIHVPLVAAAALVPLAGYPLLFLPAHLVWLELIIHPTALLAFQARPAGAAIPRGRPRRATRLLSRGDWIMIGTVGALLTTLVVAAYARGVHERGDVGHGRALALAVLILASAFVTLALGRLRTLAGAMIPAATVVVSAALVQVAPLAQVLGLSPLHADDWGLAALGALIAALPLVSILWPRAWTRSWRDTGAPRGDSAPALGTGGSP